MLPALLALPLAASAQTDDPSTLERRIADFRPELPFVESARAFVVEHARRGDSAVTRAAIRLVDERRRGDSVQWLGRYERLAIAVLLPATDIIADSIAIAALFVRDAAGDNGNPFGDDHASTLRDLVRTTAARVTGRYDDLGPSEEARRFFNLLVNHLHLRGLRGRADLSARAESFASTYPDSWRTRVLRRSIIGEYSEDRFGLAFSAGYRSANVLGGAGERLDYAHGAALSGEAYFDRMTFVVELNVGVANAPATFVAAGDTWRAGDFPYLSGAASVGYELRLNRLAVTPLVGLALHSLRAESDSGEHAPRTGFRGGLDVAAIVGYRIPFDVGTHIDLRLRGGVATMAMSGYDDVLSGSLLYLQAGFALVYRPYRPQGD
jgi:hypothetical protein